MKNPIRSAASQGNYVTVITPKEWHPYLEHYLVRASGNDNDDRELWEEITYEE